jgi:ABC-type transport system substrate-binding protein
MAASGMPSPVRRGGDFYTATVPLRSDLNWTDGTPFTAEDVAFTINAALSFQLGFDWHDYYNPDWLDHVEAVDAHTAKFYFKKAPNVGVWQYGALQGPIVQKAYWLPKIAASQALLPPSDLPSQIEALQARVADLQQQVDALNADAATAPAHGEEARQNQMTLNRQQRDLNAANNDLTKAESDFAAAMNAARQSLYTLDNKQEPTLGNWIPAGQENGAWVNKANLAHPFGEPHFDRAIYRIYNNRKEAFDAIQNNDVDELLFLEGINYRDADLFDNRPPIVLLRSSTHSVGFLVLNEANQKLSDGALHQAFACLLNGLVSETVISQTNPLNSFIPAEVYPWHNPQALLPCSGANDIQRLQKAFGILKTAGYSWDKEPSPSEAGEGIKSSDGEYIPSIVLLSQIGDPWGIAPPGVVAIAGEGIIEQEMKYLGINVYWQLVDSQDINYAVFSSHQYDMALLGWQVSEYPGYLCEWFGDGNPFGYHSDRLRSACEALDSTSDLAAAQKQVYEIQSILAQDLPFIPLYSGVTYDAYRNIAYPFDSVPGGLSGVYGAPSLAIPASP